MSRDHRGGYNRKTVNGKFFKIWSPKMAYVLGFMFADGSLIDSNKSSRTYYISFSNNDYYILNSIREAMNSQHLIYKKKSEIMSWRGNKQYRSKLGYVLRFGNKVMYEDLLKLGMKHRKSLDMTLPQVPDCLFHFFLRGYFDGDGCINLYWYKHRVTPRLRMIFTSGSTVFLAELAEKLHLLLGIHTPKFYPSIGAYNLALSCNSALTALDFIYQDLRAAPYLRRKYLKFDEYRNVYHA